MSKRFIIIFIVMVAITASQIAAEFIFRGQCSRIFQPQENGITVDLNDLVFNLHIIHPLLQNVNSSEVCQSHCLATTSPPCRSAIYHPRRRTCLLLRADKQTALEFDTRNYTSTTVSGVLITPQTLMDYVPDRKGGVARCDNFCPVPATQTPDTITPVCLKDCPSDIPVCAGEMAGCMDYPRRVTVDQVSNITNWNISSSFTFPYKLRDTIITKKYDFTHLRITISLGAWHIRPSSGCPDCHMAGNIFAVINNDKKCTGEANSVHLLRRYMLQGYKAFETAEPMHGEFSCTYYDAPSGTYPVSLYYDYTTYSGEAFGRDGEAPTVNVGSGNIAPVMIHVEEYVPPSYFMKIDNSARCQSATVFNSHSYQWANMTMNYNASSTGLLNWRVTHYKKRSDTSTLRIKWQAVLYVNFNLANLRFYFLINGQECRSPSNLMDTVIYENNQGTGYNRANPDAVTMSLDGICRGLSAGHYDISIYMDHNGAVFVGTSMNGFSIGHNSPSSMIVEEINEGLPTNALLLSDGTMVKLPYYNRQYFANAGVCSSPTCYNAVATKTYMKLQDNSALHIKWYNTHFACTGSSGSSYKEMVRFFVLINGVECNNPTKIETWWMDNMSPWGYCKIRPKYVEGICKMAIPAGPVTIKLAIGKAVMSWGSFGLAYGVKAELYNYNTYLMVEEIYEENI